MSLSFIGAFESTYLPAHDVDVLETSGHTTRWRSDLDLMRDAGVTRLRYPLRWHRIEPVQGDYRWAESDRVLGWMRDEGMRPIVDLVHHTSYPRWIEGFDDPRFGPAYLAYCEAFARRYPWVEEYTLFNEPFATLFLAGHEAIWPPYGRGMRPLVELFRNVLPPLAEASRRVGELLPDARHVYVDTCEGHSALEPGGEEYAELANDRRFFALDYMLGRLGDGGRPFVDEVVKAGGADLLDAEPGRIDVLGLDYYAHSEWAFKCRDVLAGAADGRERPPEPPGIEGVTPSPRPAGPAALAIEYAGRYELPMIFSETNIRGAPADRATWLKYTLDQCEQAVAAGVLLEGYCWFPFVDSLDWNSLLARADRCIDPVGVYWLDEDLERNASSMSRAYALAAAGAPSSELPAYRFTDEVADWVAGLLPQMEHYDWIDAPDEERGFLERGIVKARERVERAA